MPSRQSVASDDLDRGRCGRGDGVAGVPDDEEHRAGPGGERGVEGPVDEAAPGQLEEWFGGGVVAEAGSASGGEERGRDGHGLIPGRSGLRLGEGAAHQHPGEMLAVLG